MNKLNEIEKKNPFLVPEGYFEQLNQSIMESLPEKEQKVAAKVSLWKKVEPWVYLAAMFVGAFLMLQVFKATTDKRAGNHPAAISQVETAESGSWSNVHVSEEEFYEYLEEQLFNDGYYDYVYNEVMFQ